MTDILAAHGALIGALFVTCIITAGTPGPNNFIVLTARLSDTTAAALRVYLGVCLGFPVMVFVVSLTVAHYGEVIIEQLTIIKYLGIEYAATDKVALMVGMDGFGMEEDTTFMTYVGLKFSFD